MSQIHLDSRLEQWKKDFGFDLLAWVPLPRPLTFSFYSEWIKNQYHGEMKYLEEHLPLKENPSQIFETARSLLVAGVLYKPHPRPEQKQLTQLKVASYAQGEDYHFWLKERLTQLSLHIQEQIPDFQFLVATDSKPLLERDLAQQAGLGWVGKNTCLIHPQKGSFFLIGEILTNQDSPAAETNPIADHCGTCNRCLEACPTGAIEKPRQLNATKCISYWTIESKQNPPTELRAHFGDLFFGCDICQDVCPWNLKLFRQEPHRKSATPPLQKESQISELRYFLTASNRQMEKDWGDSPLLRARPRGLRRNAMIVAANLGLKELKTEIEPYLEDPELGDLAKWSLAQLSVLP